MEERRFTGRHLLAVFWVLVILALLIVPTHFQMEKQRALKEMDGDVMAPAIVIPSQSGGSPLPDMDLDGTPSSDEPAGAVEPGKAGE